MLQIEQVGVVGAGEEGTTCALLAALAGCSVRVYDPSDGALERAFEEVRRLLEDAVAARTLTRSERQRVLDRVLFTPDLDEALAGADLALQASASSPEELDGRIASALRPGAAVAAAGPEAREIAARLPQPGRVLALELAGPRGAAPHLDFAPTSTTSASVLERARAFAARVNGAWRALLPPSASMRGARG
jgi:3-hydroxyacyl-CoA dehydrogenase